MKGETLAVVTVSFLVSGIGYSQNLGLKQKFAVFFIVCHIVLTRTNKDF